MNKLRSKISREVFDYPELMSALSDYASPRAKVGALLRDGVIVRVKKGLYVFGRDYRREPVSRELLANLLYGPSFISLEYALGYYGLIPERVAQVTSVTSQRARVFETPMGGFSYRPTPHFSTGIDRAGSEASCFLIATPERALADRLRDDKRGSSRTLKGMTRYMFEDLRLDEGLTQDLDPKTLEELARLLRSRKIRVCADVIRRMRRHG